MGRDEALHQMREAADVHRERFQRAWNDGQFTVAHDHWVQEQVLRREIDKFTDSQRESIRVA